MESPTIRADEIRAGNPVFPVDDGVHELGYRAPHARQSMGAIGYARNLCRPLLEIRLLVPLIVAPG